MASIMILKVLLLTAAIASTAAKPVIEGVDWSALEEDSNEIDEELGYTWEKSGEFEGDILIGKHNNVRNGILNDNYRWPNRTLVYKIDDGYNEEQLETIHEAIEEYHAKTCIRMRPKEDDDIDYVLITPKNAQGCSSHIGRQGSEQLVKLKPYKPGRGCFKRGTIMHELLHALGFYHQQSTLDRDEYVRIVWENIKPDHRHNFRKYTSNTITNYDVKYDYSSIMHYSSYAFSTNKEMTIIPLREGAQIGQRDGFSPSDIRKLHLMYGCPMKIDETVENGPHTGYEVDTDTDDLESLFEK